MTVEYSPANYKPKKVGKKWRITVFIHYGLTKPQKAEADIWGDTREEVLAKCSEFLVGCEPAKEEKV